MDTLLIVTLIGAFAFGAVTGWTAYFIIRRAKPSALSDLSTILGILGGATILALFDAKGALFGAYAIGLAAGFFGYYRAYFNVVKATAIREAILNEKDGGTVLE